jgi:predicted MFS family arabinose efflux permease
MPALQERRLLLLLAAIQFVNVLDFVIMMPLGPLFIDDLRISPAELGLLVSSYTIAASLSSLAFGRWVNRQPRKTALLISFGVFGIATFFCGVAHEYWTLLTARIIAGMAGGPATSVVLTIVADATAPERRGRALATVQSAFPVASVLGVPAGLYLATAGSWRTPFLVLAAAAVLLWIFIALRLPRFDSHLQSALGDSNSTWETLRLVVADRASRRAYLTHLLVMAGGFALIPFLSPYLVNNRGVSQDDLGLFYLFGGIITFLMMQVIGRVTDRFGSLRVYATVVTLYSLNMQIILWYPIEGLALIPLFSLYMMFNSARMVPLITLYSKIPPPETRGAFMSYLSTVQHLGAGVGTLIAGLFLTLDATGKLQNFNAAGEASVLIGLSVIFFARTLKAQGDGDPKPIAP